MASDRDAIILSLAAWRGRHLRKAWRPIILLDGYHTQTVQFGGVPLLSDGEAWPRCSECQWPMQLLLQFDLARLPCGLLPLSEGYLQYFQCSRYGTCAVSSEEDWRPFGRGKLVRIVEGSDLRSSAIPEALKPFPLLQVARWEPFWDVPGTAEHERLGLEYRYEFSTGITRTTVAWHEGGVTPGEPLVADNREPGVAEAIAEAANGDKLGGWPLWVQSALYPACPECGSEMRYLLQLGYWDHLPIDLGDYGTGQMFYCAEHPRRLTFTFQCS